jgi:membrane-associated phospholipid phosphatase
MHVGYALIVAAGLVRHGRRLLVRAIGALYPPFVLLVVVATGNHFFVDAAGGALVAGLAAALAALLTPRPATARLAGERTQLGDRVGHHNGCLVLGRG